MLAPALLILSTVALLLGDLVSWIRPRKVSRDVTPSNRAASVVIPNWNGRDLLENYLPSVITALEDNPQNEIIVVDDGSTDGSAEYIRERFPYIRLIALKENLGFGGSSNTGFRAASNDIVVLLNSDMLVDPDFLQPLLDGFTDPQVFAVSCQIFFSNPKKPRQETGLTEGWWQQGSLRVRHRVEPEIRGLHPCFYGGGGSCAFDRRKFLELGGFDELYRPFYLEDTDLGYLAWKRGWKVLYQPASVVFHEHRGTIGKNFSEAYIHSVLQRNFLLFTWKNIHDWRKLAAHFVFTWGAATLSWLAGNSPERPSYASIARAFVALPHALASRAKARGLATITDAEAFRRPLGGHYRDTFAPLPVDPRKLSVLFVAPYPICPPVHGGGVFMNQTVRELARLCDLHLIILLDHERERAAHQELEHICASITMVVRREERQKALGSPEPHAAREFRNRDLAWLIHRQLYSHQVDVLQLEYMVMGQYAGGFRRIPSILFEHDVYFQSIARRLPYMAGALEKVTARWEYLRSLRYELKLLPKLDRVQVCSRDNAEYLRSFVPQLSGRIDDGFRAGIDTSLYEFRNNGRDPYTLLFLGSFRHLPNAEALQWFLQDVFPRIRQEEPRARLVIVGAEPPPRYSLKGAEAIEMVGFVDDVREPLARYALFVCPILAGSGVRVKLLEAFAAGIPVVSTRVGAEGLADKDGEICALADDPAAFASHVVHLLQHTEEAAAMVQRARDEAVARKDMRVMTERMVECYRAEVRRMRSEEPRGEEVTSSQPEPEPQPAERGRADLKV